jgi:hypothetical protein
MKKDLTSPKTKYLVLDKETLKRLTVKSGAQAPMSHNALLTCIPTAA